MRKLLRPPNLTNGWWDPKSHHIWQSVNESYESVPRNNDGHWMVIGYSLDIHWIFDSN
jgi:hypothetical protein